MRLIHHCVILVAKRFVPDERESGSATTGKHQFGQSEKSGEILRIDFDRLTAALSRSGDAVEPVRRRRRKSTLTKPFGKFRDGGAVGR